MLTRTSNVSAAPLIVCLALLAGCTSSAALSDESRQHVPDLPGATESATLVGTAQSVRALDYSYTISTPTEERLMGFAVPCYWATLFTIDRMLEGQEPNAGDPVRCFYVITTTPRYREGQKYILSIQTLLPPAMYSVADSVRHLPAREWSERAEAEVQRPLGR